MTSGSKLPPLIVVDATGLLFRSYYAIRGMRAGTQPTNAVYGLVNSLVKLRTTYPDTAICCVMDAPGKTFRHDIFPEYKANRKETEEDLISQIQPSKDFIVALGMPLYCEVGVEADDVIATLATTSIANGRTCDVATADKDLMYLVSKGCKIIAPDGETILDEKKVQEKYGVPAQQMPQLQTLTGDSTDNIPGIPKVGPKTAAKWLQTYGSLEQIIQAKDEIKGKVGENFRNNLDLLELTKKTSNAKRRCGAKTIRRS